MNKLETLISSVELQKPISFEYNKPGKPIGERIGNVHAIFIMTKKSGKLSTKVHIVQTDGVSDSKDRNPFPNFRMFNIESIESVRILSDAPVFEVNEKYNPDWDGYAKPIAKV